MSLERRIQAGCENVVEVTVECTEGEGRAPQEKAVGSARWHRSLVSFKSKGQKAGKTWAGFAGWAIVVDRID